MQVSGSTAFSEPIHQRNKHSSKYIRTGSLANLSLNQAQKVINYIKGERQMQMQMPSMWIPVTSKERSHVRVTVALTLPG